MGGQVSVGLSVGLPAGGVGSVPGRKGKAITGRGGGH